MNHLIRQVGRPRRGRLAVLALVASTTACMSDSVDLSKQRLCDGLAAHRGSGYQPNAREPLRALVLEYADVTSGDLRDSARALGERTDTFDGVRWKRSVDAVIAVCERDGWVRSNVK